MRRLFAIALVLMSCSWARAQDLPEDLAKVPGGAIGFVHVRVDELVKSSAFKIYADVFPKAGADALKLLEERIVPPITFIDRVTAVYMPPDHATGTAEGFAVLIHVNKPLDQKKLVAGLNTVVSKLGITSYSFDGDRRLQVLGKNTFMLGSATAPELLAGGGKASPEFKQALALAASGKKMVVSGGNNALLPPQAFAGAPPMVQALAKAKSSLATLDLGKETIVEVELGFETADQAKDAQRALEDLRQVGKKYLQQAKSEMEKKLTDDGDRAVPIYEFEKVGEILGPVFAIGYFKRGEELLAGIPITQTDKSLKVKVVVPEEISGYANMLPMYAALLVPAVSKVRKSAERVQSSTNMKQLALAMHTYHDNFNRLPPPALCDKAGKPLLSWRVAVLPFIEEAALYQEFKLDEPWDSDHNKKLIARMPKVFEMPGKSEVGRTHFRVPVGKDAIFFSPTDKIRLGQIADGTTNTIMIVETADSVPWTKPDEFDYGPGPLPKLYRRNGLYMLGFADSSIRYVRDTVAEAALRAAFTRNGGEVVELPED